MDTLQFALFFSAILIAYVLVHLRLAKFESHLREIAGLKVLNERLKGVSDVLERVRLDHVEDLLGQLHDDLRAIHEGQSQIERLLSRPAPAPVLVGEERRERTDRVESAASRIRAAVEDRLLGLGYSDLRILSDLSDSTLDTDTAVRVECSRQNMIAKGKVTTRNGAVVDIDLTPVARVFP